MIDRLRHELQERLEQVLGEAERLRHALAALDPRSDRDGGSRSGSGGGRDDRSAAAAAVRGGTGARSSAGVGAGSGLQSGLAPDGSGSRSTTAAGRRSGGQSAAGSRKRSAPGATRRQVLDALSADDPKTAGEVAAITGLARGTVSTTLSKMVSSGEVAKAERGYRLPAPDLSNS